MTGAATHNTAMLDLAKRFFAAVTSGDLDAVRACYAPGAVIWHNNDGVSQTVEQNLQVLGWIAANVKEFRYEDVLVQPTPAGFVEQHVTCGTGPGGKPFAVRACIVCTVVDGRVTRLDEYVDPAQVAAITG
jgi:ketosteroid isomerase-like protein